ncbi:hypothetical protein GCM10009736_71180 [Actinomadura bangladeshensis]
MAPGLLAHAGMGSATFIEGGRRLKAVEAAEGSMSGRGAESDLQYLCKSGHEASVTATRSVTADVPANAIEQYQAAYYYEWPPGRSWELL